MPRHVRDSNLATREARARLKARGKPYWRLIEPGLHLGYRRLAGKPGTWCVRRYAGEQSYTVESIKGVVADDYATADGITVLNFRQAQQAALARKPKAGPLTVQEAVENYLRHLEARTGTYDAGLRAQAFIFPQIGHEKVETLTTVSYANGLTTSPPHLAASARPPVRSNGIVRWIRAQKEKGDVGRARIGCWSR